MNYLKTENVYLVPREDFIVEENELIELETICTMGVIEPVIARIAKKGLEIISGKQRVLASKEAVPTIIRNYNCDEATAYRTSCLFDTGKHSIAELSYIIFEQYRILKHQGKRSSDNSSLDIMRDYFKMSKRNISRYLRLYYLTDELKICIDKGQLSIKAGVELSYINKCDQDIIKGLIDDGLCIDISMAQNIKQSYQKNNGLKLNVLKNLKDVKRKGFKRMYNLYDKYNLQRYSDKEVEAILDEALYLYFSKNSKCKWL